MFLGLIYALKTIIINLLPNFGISEGDFKMCSSIKVFPAANGDCFLVKIKIGTNYKYILIDGGKGVLCHQKLKEEFKYLEENQQQLDLLVLTHIDDDHIAGILKLYQDNKINTSIINKVWFNSGALISSEFSNQVATNREIPLAPLSRKMSVRQGVTLEKRMQASSSWYQKLIFSGQKHLLDDIEIYILSPDVETLKDLNSKWEDEIKKMNAKKAQKRKMSFVTDYHKNFDELCAETFEEDKSVFNRSSIAFLLKYKDYKILMLGDSHPSIIITSLKELGYSEKNKLKVNVMKVSHHGSKKNTCNELLNMLDCTNFIVSTDGSKHGLPNKQSLARIVRAMGKPVNFYFNYSSMNKVFSQEEREKYNITCHYLNNKNNYTVRD